MVVNKTKVVCYESGEVFDSIAAAAARMGCTSTNIGNAIRLGHAAGGFHWYRADQPKPDESRFSKRGRPGNPVVCVETGTRYPSGAAAAASCDIAKSSISRAATKGFAAGGYHWRYEDQEG